MAIAAIPAAAATAGTASGSATSGRAVSGLAVNGHVLTPNHPAILTNGGAQAGAGPLATPIKTSVNWAGYAATHKTSTGVFHSITATFTVPSVNCTATPGNPPDGTQSMHWVGLDGLNSKTIEPAGFFSVCQLGTPEYASFFEMFPLGPKQATVQANPGDAFRVTVSYNSSTKKFSLTLNDLTTAQTQTMTAKCPARSTCKRSSAEVISEAPATTSGVVPLADYGLVNYTNVSISGPAGHVGGFSNGGWNNFEIVQHGATTGKVIAQPSRLWAGEAFDVRWRGQN